MPVKLLKKGSKGKAVERWQQFLAGIHLYIGKVDGDFGSLTESATIRLQQANGLMPDGIVGENTYTVAKKYGFDPNEKTSEWFPEKPGFKPLTQKGREKLFGKFEYEAAPTPNNAEGIRVLGDWRRENIVMVDLPELAEATGGKYTRMQFHRLAEYQLRMLWKEWKEEGLLDRILTYAGAYNPRFIRGSRTVLSNHSFGTAFDINAAWNGLGRVPAKKGQRGSVVELVPAANKWGFYWGGFFSGRPDGMHFEVAKIIEER